MITLYKWRERTGNYKYERSKGICSQGNIGKLFLAIIGGELRGLKSLGKSYMRKLCQLLFDVQMNMNTRISDSVNLSEKD